MKIFKHFALVALLAMFLTGIGSAFGASEAKAMTTCGNATCGTAKRIALKKTATAPPKSAVARGITIPR